MLSWMISNFPISAILGVGHFDFCNKMLYFANAWTYHYETLFGSSAWCPEGVWEVLDQCHLVVKKIIYMLTTLDVVDLFSSFPWIPESLPSPTIPNMLGFALWFVQCCVLALKKLSPISMIPLVRSRQNHRRKIGNIGRWLNINGQMSKFW